MEVDFDKEIDAMLRKAQHDAPVLVGDFASSRHLDADEISAFAENAMPEKSRSLHMAHLADCDRCRKILSNLLVMNSEAAPVSTSPGVITIAERAPWYKGLFLFPNLAYLMGGLVLIFSGFLGYTIFQKSGVTGDTTISQANAPAETNFQADFPLQDSTGSANTMANSAPNANVMPSAFSSNSNVSALGRTDNGRGPAADEKLAENNFLMDGADTSAGVTAPVPPSSASATQPSFGGQKAARDKDDVAKEKDENKVATDVTTASESPKYDASISKQKQYQLPSQSAQSGPMRNNENQYNRQLENLERQRGAAPAKKAVTREEESAAGTRAVGGKTFERKQGVWYDVAYQGRPTINVRRGSAEYNKLDAGLKSIANSLSGTVVIVWGAKAYRIQ